MRVVFVALLAIGVLNALPLEQASGLEASGTESSGLEVVIEGSGLVEDGSGVIAVEEVEVEEALIRARRGVEPLVTEARHESPEQKESHSESDETNDAKGLVNDKAGLRDSQDQQNSTVEVVEEGSGSETTDAAKCPVLGECQNDEDCNGGSCIGAAVGTCNCNACLNYWPCSKDADCGGFNKACNTTTLMCDCFGAYVSNGFKDTLDAVGSFCNVKKCGLDSADCYGLPCNSGHCFC